MKNVILYAAMGAALLSASHAQTYTDIEHWLNQRSYERAESVLTERLSTNANDDSALYLLGQIPVRTREEKRYDEAIARLKRCVELKPNVSNYHLWLGRAYGLKAQSSGIFSAMRYASDVKNAFLKAAELDPANFQAQYDLVQFYLRAPGIAGGSMAKASDIARKHEKINAEQASLLWFAIHFSDDELEKAEAVLRSMRQPSDSLSLRLYRGSLLRLANRLLENDEATRAQAVAEFFVSRFPDNAFGYHTLGRCLFDQQKYDDAIDRFEKALAIDKTVGSQYRLGQIYELKGEKQKAIDVYEEFLSIRQGRKDDTINDVRKRLTALRHAN